jgi:hypothetical protein
MSDILFFISYFDDSFIPAWTTELVHAHQAQGDVGWIVKCAQGLERCHAAKLGRDDQTCVRCVSRTHYVLRRLAVPPGNVAEIPHDPEVDRMRLPSFPTVDELKRFTFDGVNVGMGAASALISGLRDHQFAPADEAENVEASLRTAIRVVLFFRRYFAERRPDLVYTFNGRFAESRPLVEMCIANGIPFRTYEIGSRTSRYQLFENTLPHDLARYRSRIDAFWEANSNDVEKEAAAIAWFENRRYGVSQEDNQPVFIESQKRHSLPSGFDERKLNVAIFNSSEDEYAAIGDAASFALYRDQNEALTRLLERIGANTDLHLYLRIHPNLGGLDNTQNREVLALRAPNFTLIPAESTIDSYALLSNCNRVLTFGSTIGVEATFWGMPSILFGRALYENLGVAYEPTTYEELERLLTTERLRPQPRLAALKYGYWASGAGYDVRAFRDLLAPDCYSAYDRCGQVYQRVMRGLRKIGYPITYTPFYNRILRAVARRSRRDFYSGGS